MSLDWIDAVLFIIHTHTAYCGDIFILLSLRGYTTEGHGKFHVHPNNWFKRLYQVAWHSCAITWKKKHKKFCYYKTWSYTYLDISLLRSKQGKTNQTPKIGGAFMAWGACVKEATLCSSSSSACYFRISCMSLMHGYVVVLSLPSSPRHDGSLWPTLHAHAGSPWGLAECGPNATSPCRGASPASSPSSARYAWIPWHASSG